MGQTPCISQYFTNLSQTALRLGILTVESGGHGIYDISPKLPFIPIAGLTAAGVPVPVADQKLNDATWPALFGDIYIAGQNAVNEIFINPTMDVPSAYDQYLYKKLKGQAGNLLAYNGQGIYIKNFWDSVDLAATPAQYVAYVQTLFETIGKTFDRSLFCPPGHYNFTVCAFQAAWMAWLDEVGSTVNRILTVELISF